MRLEELDPNDSRSSLSCPKLQPAGQLALLRTTSSLNQTPSLNMKLQFLTLNAHELNDNEAPSALHNYFQDKTHNLDIICRHKYKLRGSKLTLLGSHIWKEATYLVHEAAPTYKHSTTNPRAKSSGIGMLIGPSINHLIHSYGALLHNHVQ